MLILLVFLLSFACYYLAKRRIIFLVTQYQIKPRSLPGYYGINIAAWNLSASILAIILIYFFKYFALPVNYAYGYVAVISIFFVLVVYIFAALKGQFRAQFYFELTIRRLLNFAALASIFITIAILFSVIFESIEFFKFVPIEEFLLGKKWFPQTRIFGLIPVLTGTLLITFIAMCVAIPLGLYSAIYLTEYANKKVRNLVKPILEILAGIPTIVYGYFAALIVGPFIRHIGEFFGLNVSTESALAAGLVMGVMIIPFIVSLSDDAIVAVPQTLRDAALALGSTKAETIKKVVLFAAKPGIIGAILLAISRAIGETMIVAMAAGMDAKLTANPLESVSTFTVQIASLLVGDQEFDNPKTLAAFALALALFVITLCINLYALIIMRRAKKYYE